MLHIGRRILLMIGTVLLMFGGLPGWSGWGGYNAYASSVTWNTLGGSFSVGPILTSSIYVDEGTPYVAYTDHGLGRRALVSMFDGAGWVPLGSQHFSSTNVDGLSLIVDEGTPYLAYGADHVNVVQYNGSEWVQIGGAVSANYSGYVSLQVYNGTPHVAYFDSGVRVKKYDGEEWVLVAQYDYDGWIERASFSFDHNGTTLYASLNIYDNQGLPRPLLLKYEGDQWVELSNDPFFPELMFALHTSMAVDNGIPYLAFVDLVESKLVVCKYEAGSWSYVGSLDGINVDVIQFVHFSIDHSIPFIAYSDTSARVAVMKYLNSEWIQVGNQGAMQSLDRFIDFDVFEGIPFISLTNASGLGYVSTFIQTPPVLTADPTNPQSSSGLTLTFEDDAVWRASIISVKDGAITLVEGEDYIIGTGSITFPPFRLAAGDHTITVLASGYGSTSVVQSILPSDAPYLQSLSLSDGSGGDLNEAFIPSRTSYTQTAPYWATSVNVRALAEKLTSTVTVNGIQVIGGFGVEVPLATGENSVDIIVTAAGGETLYYSVTVTRLANSGLMNLSSRAPHALNETFYYRDTSYTMDVGNAVSNVSFFLTLIDAEANVAVNGVAVQKSAGQFETPLIPLDVGANTIQIVVEAVDHSTTIYTVTVTREASGNADLSGLDVSSGALNEPFEADTVAYTQSVANSVASVTVTPAVADATATVAVNGSTVADGEQSGAIALHVGANEITIVVTAQNGTTKTYTVTITRAAEPFTVTFDSLGGSAIDSQTVINGDKAMKPDDPTRIGHTLEGWYREASHDTLWSFDTDVVTGHMTLYARWTINSYAVIYDGNGSDGGSVPADSSHAYHTSVTVPGNPGGLVRTGYTFAGWMTEADGSGTSYAESDTFAMGAADVTLYAKWTVGSHIVMYDGNGSTGGSVPADSSHPYHTSVIVPGNPGGLEKTGHTFAGWMTEADGSGTSYAESDTFTMGAADVTLYAKWTINSYLVTYSGNGASSGSVPADSSHHYHTSVMIPGNPGGLEKTGHTFAGWSTEADGSGDNYGEADTFVIGAANVTLYAKWTVNLYSVSFDSNGGSPVSSQTVSYGSTAVEPAEPTKTGYAFAGWYADPGTLMEPFDFTAPIGATDVTLYARWFSANALLSGMSADQGTLRPAFSPSNANYVIDVEKTVTELSLFLIKGDPAQSITVTGATYVSVTDNVYAYQTSGLTVEPHLIVITITAENQDQNIYQLTVNVSADEAMGQPVALDPSVRLLTFPGGLSILLPEGLTIPAGATLTVNNSNAAPPEEGTLSIAGQVIDFQFEGIAIDLPVEITLGYNDEITDPSKLAIFYFNASTGKWEYQPSQVTDNGVKASVSHFSIYGVLADTAAPEQVTVESGVITTNSITLHLYAVDGSGVAKYMIYRDGTLIGETAERIYTDTGLSRSRAYTYTIQAVDLLGNISSDSASITVTTRSGSSGGSGSGSHTNGASATDGTVISTDGTLTLPVNRSGEVRLGDGVRIVIPAGALDEELKITIIQVPDTDTQKLIRSNDILLSPVFDLLKNVSKNFSKAVTLTFAFDPASLTDDRKPSLLFYDESKQEWVEAGGEVDGNTITASVTHFAKFAVFAVEQQSETAPDVIPAIRFNDINGHWAEANIQAAVAAGIVQGYDDATFRPDMNVTRAEFAVMLMNALKPRATGAKLTFTDTSEIGLWAREAVAQAVEAGIVNGYADGRFRPGANITRAELAVMIARAYGADIKTDVSAPTGFADDGDIPPWAKGEIAAIRQLGIVQGRDGNLFAPESTATRAEAVTIILNLLQKMLPQ